MRAHQKYLGESVTGTKCRIRKRQCGLGGSNSNWGFWWWCWYNMQTNYGISSVHAQWFSCRKVEQTIVTSSNDVTVISCATGGGKYIRKARLEPWGCHLDFWHWMVGSFIKSPTLYSSYVSASHGARLYPGWTVYLVYSHACTQTFWEHCS